MPPDAVDRANRPPEPEEAAMPTLIHDPDVLAQEVDGRAVADYTSLHADGARRCDGHSLDNTAGYVVRRTRDEDGQDVTDPATPDRVGLDVYAVACEPRWGHYDKALTAARAYRSGRSYAVVDTLYRCGHRGAA